MPTAASMNRPMPPQTLNFTTDTWVNFKVWGGIGLFMLAAVGTVASVARYLPEQS